jgi:predicted nucleic acid-binding protein
MTVRVFADTNLFIYAESQDQDKSSRAVAIIQDAPVTSGLLYFATGEDAPLA